MDEKFCPNCGAPVAPGEKACKFCGTALIQEAPVEYADAGAPSYGYNTVSGQESGSARPPKKKVTAILLAVLLGCAGIHCFYLRHYVRGVIYLIASLFGLEPLIFLLSVAEGIYMAVISDEKFEEKYKVELLK